MMKAIHDSVRSKEVALGTAEGKKQAEARSSAPCLNYLAKNKRIKLKHKSSPCFCLGSLFRGLLAHWVAHIRNKTKVKKNNRGKTVKFIDIK